MLYVGGIHIILGLEGAYDYLGIHIILGLTLTYNCFMLVVFI